MPNNVLQYLFFCMKYKPAVHALIISPLFLLKMCMVNNFHIIFYEITLFIRKLRAKFLIYHCNPYEFSCIKNANISEKKEIPYKNF